VTPYASPPAATLVYVDNPFVPVCARDARRIELFADKPTMLAEVVQPLLVARPGQEMTVTVNGQYHLPSMGERVIANGDIIVVLNEMQGGGGDSMRTVLQMAITIAGYAIGGPIGGMIASMIAGPLLNNLIPPSHGDIATPGQQASPTYTFSLSGNQLAQQGEPIAVGYGWMRSFPKMAAQPYVEYDSNDQYYYAVLEVGQGKYSIPRVEIDDTDIAHFDSIEHRVVNPGESLTLALANVVTAPEVTAQDLLTGVRVGGFNACGPGLTATDVGFDITLNGLGKQGSGALASASVSIKFEVRSVDDFGRPTSAWSTLATETITDATTGQVRRSFKYTLASAMRPQVRAVRTDVKDETLGSLNSPQWSGLRAYLSQPAPLCATATYVEIKAKANEQLNGLSQRRIAVFAQRLIKTWNPDTGWSATEVESRSIPWAIADALKSPIYGKSMPDNRIDLQTLYDLDQIYIARQDHFDGVFDTASTADEIVNIIAKCGRAVCMPRGGVWTLMRDQQQTLPVCVYTPRMMIAENGSSSFSMTKQLWVDETPDGVIVEYFSNVEWDWRRITCPIPGLTAEEVTNPVVVRIVGICGAKQAEREGLYIAADTFYRRTSLKFTVMLDGYLPAYGSLVTVGHDIAKWGVHGDVVAWDEASLTMTLTEAPDWSAPGNHYIILQRPDGTPHPAILCEEGPSSNEAYLAAAPDFDPVFDDADRERTKYTVGTATTSAVDCRVKSIVPRVGRRLEMGCIKEDNRVHTVDNALLPAEGEIQDPIDALPGSDEGGDLPIVNLSSHSMSNTTTEGTVAGTSFQLKNDGSMRLDGFMTDFCSGEWLLSNPLTTTETALFEVRATQLAGDTLAGGSSALGVWLNCATNRTWSIATSGLVESKSCSLLIEIRDAATSTLQDSTTIYLTAETIHVDGG